MIGFITLRTIISLSVSLETSVQNKKHSPGKRMSELLVSRSRVGVRKTQIYGPVRQQGEGGDPVHNQNSFF